MLYKSFSRLSPCKTTQVRTPGDSKVVSLRTDRCVTCVGPDVRRLISAINRPTLGPKLALTRPNSPLAIMCKFPYLALTRLNSPTLATAKWIPISMGVIHLTRLQTGPTGSGPPERWTSFFETFPTESIQ